MSLSQYKNHSALSDAQVLDIRRDVMDTNKVFKRDAESLIRLNEQILEPIESWVQLFTDAITDFVVDDTSINRIVNDENAKWLVDLVKNDGKLDAETELNLIVKILDKADIVARPLEVYMLQAVEEAILHGTGSWAKGRSLEAGRIGQDDVELLRKVVYSVGGEGGIDISREEAELIYNIHDASIHADNHESWTDLFSKIMSCYVMAGQSSHEVSEDVAYAREAWLKSDKGFEWSNWSVSAVFKAMGGLKDAALLRNNLCDDPELIPANLSAAQAELESVTDAEADWLVERINRDGELTVSEVRMLHYIKQEAPAIPASLARFIKDMAFR